METADGSSTGFPVCQEGEGMTVNEWAAGGMSQDGFFNLSGWIVYDPYLELWAVLCSGSGRCFFA
jgi:hypothetical protein